MDKQPVHTILEARRYVDNARQLLSEKAGKEGKSYTDRKYVKMAGHTAYVGVLEALDTLYKRTGQGRRTTDWYLLKLISTDRKLLDKFNEAYSTLHLAMSYDGNTRVAIAQDGLLIANEIIDWVETRLGQNS